MECQSRLVPAGAFVQDDDASVTRIVRSHRPLVPAGTGAPGRTDGDGASRAEIG